MTALSYEETQVMNLYCHDCGEHRLRLHIHLRSDQSIALRELCIEIFLRYKSNERPVCPNLSNVNKRTV